MDSNNQLVPSGDPLLPPHGGRSRRRFRERPMWGCVKAILWLTIVGFILLFLGIGTGWWYVGSSNFAEYILEKIDATLEAKLGRAVEIRRVTVDRGKRKVIIDDIRIANAPGAVNPWFATVRQVEITGGIDSFWGRRVRLGRVDIRDPKLFVEVYPAGAPLIHNFPRWKTGPPRKYEIARVDIKKMFITGGGLEFLDRRHDIKATIEGMASEVTPTFSEQIYEGFAESPRTVIRLQDYEPIVTTLRGGFRYEPGSLELKSIALHGDRLQTFVSGKLDPLTEGVYDLKITTKAELEKVREIFRVEKVLEGTLAIDGKLTGRQGDFKLTGSFAAPKIQADAYDLSDLKGTLDVTGERTHVDISSGSYGGGSISGTYQLAKYAEPYPMILDLNYDRVSIEKLFSDWNLKNIGLRGAATGTLSYAWNKDRILDGRGEGSARLRPGTVAFGNAKYPVPVSGSTRFGLERGTIRFARSSLDTPASHIDFSGSLRIDDLMANLDLDIRGRDFAELDRIAYNIARAADQKDFELLGFGGAGTIRATVRGPLKSPLVTASIAATNTKYNNVLLGTSDIVLRYDGPKNLLTFDRGLFQADGGSMALTGTIGFPDRGPSPRFNLELAADNWSVERALQVIELDLAIHGNGTGRLAVVGSPDSGTVTFKDLNIQREQSAVRLTGDLSWAPGKGNLTFDLDVAATDFPVDELMAFLDIRGIPVKGVLTGTLHLQGKKTALEGSGAVTIRNGEIYGEPVDMATADLVFTEGKMKASNIHLTSPGGVVTGEAEFDFGTEQFNYSIQSADLDVSRVKLLAGLGKFFGGRLQITSSGAGTLDQPELVIDATLNQATLQGIDVPEGTPPPKLYVALRNGQLIIKGGAFDLFSIDGTGTVGAGNALDGTARIVITDVAKFLATFAPRTQLPVSGSLTMDLTLGGQITPFEALRIDGVIPELNLRFADHQVVSDGPVILALREGLLRFESFKLRSNGSAFTLAGSVGLTGDRPMNLTANGLVEAALFQLFIPELKADGQINVAAGLTGTASDPRINGTAEIREADFRVPGFPQLIEDVTGTIVFKGEKIELDSLRASLGGGTVVAGGFMDVSGLSVQRVRLNIRGEEVSVRYFDGVTVDGDFEMLLSGDMERMLLQGEVNVDRALYFKDFDFATSILNLILERRGLVPIVAASWQDRVALRVNLKAQDTLAVKNNVADVTGSAELELAGTLGNPVLLGLVTIDEGGTVRFQDVDYRVVRGTINFQNPFRIDPYFDITAEGRIDQTVEGGSEQYQLTVNITGTLDRITPTITSDPPLGELTLLSILGPSTLGQDSTSALTAGSLSQTGSSLLMQSLGGLIGSKILPFADSFRFDPGLLGADPEPKVTFEKRVSSDLRVILIYYLNDDRSRQIIEWQVNPEWVVQFSGETERLDSYLINAIDGRFRRRYDGHWGDKKEGVPVRLPPQTQGIVFRETPEETTSPVPDSAGREVIAAIRYRTDAPYDTSRLGDLIALQTGSPVTLRELQSSIENLYATGDFRDIQVDSESSGGGANVTFILSLNYRVTSVTAEGLERSKFERMGKEVPIHSGDVLSLNAVDRSAQEIQTTLSRQGYREATVDPEVRFVRARSQAEVIFHVVPGPRARIGTIEFTGDLAPFSPEEIRKAMRRKTGDYFRTDDARRDADRIRGFLVKKKYRRANVRFSGDTYDPETNLVNLRYRVNVGPTVRVEVQGASRDEVRKMLPFRRSGEYSEDLLQRSTDDILENFQRRGYFRATVDLEEQLVGNEWVITFKINKGERYRLKAVDFSGNTKISDEKLRRVVATSRPGFIRGLVSTLLRRPTGVTGKQLADDREGLETFYRLEGFSEANVDQPAINTQTGALTVTFPITEGPQTLVTAVMVEGNEQVRSGKLPDLLLENGKPLNPLALEADLIALRTHYADRGNIEIQVSPETQLSADMTSATVTYRIAEGPRVTVDDVIVRGNTYTDTDVVLRKAGLRQGEPFTYRSLLEAQRDLYRLGIFQRVDIFPEKTGVTLNDRDVAIEVEEAKDLTLAGSIGYSTEDRVRISLAASHRNLFGSARYLGLEALVSDRRERYFATYREPFIFDYDIPTQFTLFRSDERQKGATIRRLGTFIEASRVVRDQTRWSLRYEYRIVDCTEGELCPRFAAPGTPRDEREIEISSVSPAFFWDRRDDPLNPRRGFFASSSLEYAFPLFRAETNFLKGFAQGAWYRPISTRSSIAVSGRIGLIDNLSRPKDGVVVEVPFSEQFTGGGESSHRAFETDTLGILCTGEDGPDCRSTLVIGDNGEILALGGNALLIVNVEYRFPIFGSLFGTGFVDAGNIWRDIGAIDTGELRYGVGSGLVYISPLGPIRADVGYKLDQKDFEDSYAFFLSFGYAF